MDDGPAILCIICHFVTSIQPRVKRHQRQKRKPSTQKQVPSKVKLPHPASMITRGLSKTDRIRLPPFLLNPLTDFVTGLATLVPSKLSCIKSLQAKSTGIWARQNRSFLQRPCFAVGPIIQFALRWCVQLDASCRQRYPKSGKSLD